MCGCVAYIYMFHNNSSLKGKLNIMNERQLSLIKNYMSIFE